MGFYTQHIVSTKRGVVWNFGLASLRRSKHDGCSVRQQVTTLDLATNPTLAGRCTRFYPQGLLVRQG
jgi:hypothetical protein